MEFNNEKKTLPMLIESPPLDVEYEPKLQKSVLRFIQKVRLFLLFSSKDHVDFIEIKYCCPNFLIPRNDQKDIRQTILLENPSIFTVVQGEGRGFFGLRHVSSEMLELKNAVEPWLCNLHSYLQTIGGWISNMELLEEIPRPHNVPPGRDLTLNLLLSSNPERFEIRHRIQDDVQDVIMVKVSSRNLIWMSCPPTGSPVTVAPNDNEIVPCVPVVPDKESKKLSDSNAFRKCFGRIHYYIAFSSSARRTIEDIRTNLFQDSNADKAGTFSDEMIIEALTDASDTFILVREHDSPRNRIWISLCDSLCGHALMMRTMAVEWLENIRKHLQKVGPIRIDLLTTATSAFVGKPPQRLVEFIFPTKLHVATVLKAESAMFRVYSVEGSVFQNVTTVEEFTADRPPKTSDWYKRLQIHAKRRPPLPNVSKSGEMWREKVASYLYEQKIFSPTEAIVLKDLYGVIKCPKAMTPSPTLILRVDPQNRLFIIYNKDTTLIFYNKYGPLMKSWADKVAEYLEECRVTSGSSKVELNSLIRIIPRPSGLARSAKLKQTLIDDSYSRFIFPSADSVMLKSDLAVSGGVSGDQNSNHTDSTALGNNIDDESAASVDDWAAASASASASASATVTVTANAVAVAVGNNPTMAKDTVRSTGTFTSTAGTGTSWLLEPSNLTAAAGLGPVVPVEHSVSDNGLFQLFGDNSNSSSFNSNIGIGINNAKDSTPPGFGLVYDSRLQNAASTPDLKSLSLVGSRSSNSRTSTIASWLPEAFDGFPPSLVNTFVIALNDEGFVTVDDLIVAHESDLLGADYLSTLGFKRGHYSRLIKGLTND